LGFFFGNGNAIGFAFSFDDAACDEVLLILHIIIHSIKKEGFFELDEFEKERTAFEPKAGLIGGWKWLVCQVYWLFV
jgi:hypothetical protein